MVIEQEVFFNEFICNQFRLDEFKFSPNFKHKIEKYLNVKISSVINEKLIYTNVCLDAELVLTSV